MNNIGLKLNRLTALKLIKKVKSRRYYLCQCDCGEHREVEWGKLQQNLAKECKNCAKQTLSKSVSKTAVKHGMYNTPIYNSWYGLKARCDNPNTDYYHRYGGRV